MFLITDTTVYSQSDTTTTAKTKPVTLLKDLIQFSTAEVRSNLNFTGKINGYFNGSGTYIKDIGPLETTSFETGNYDSIQFYFDLPYSYVDKFFIQVKKNEPFTFRTIPVQDLIGLEMIITNIKKYKGEKLYELEIFDDADNRQIEVTASLESAPFINIVKIGDTSALYQIKLKNTYEFNKDVGQEIQDNIKKGKEVIIPVGVIMRDAAVKDDVQEYKIYLKKNKKQIKKN